MPTPSLLIVPARFKSGKLYSQIPTSGAGDFTVTRATAATRVDASGLIQSVASGIPRLDYFASGGTVGCPALLVEPSAQNLAFHSESWVSGNNWTLTDATNVTGATSAPNGNATANALSPTAASGSHFVFSNNTTTVSYTSGTIYTQSAFFKAGTGSAGQFVQLTFSSARFTQTGYANFDLIAGTVSVVSGSSADTNRAAKIENYGNGWYRCIFTATCNSTGTGAGLIISLITSTGSGRIPSFSGVTGDILYAWGAQLETGSVATSYIPTTTGSVTRNADVVSVSGAVSGSIGQTEGTLYAEVDLRNLPSVGAILSINTGNAADRIELYTLSNGKVNFDRIATTESAGTTATSTSTFAINSILKIAVAYKSGDCIMYVNGTQETTQQTPTFTFNTLFRVSLGVGRLNTSQANNRIRAAALYTTRLTNAQLASLTTP